jgi:hypothetical protein
LLSLLSFSRMAQSSSALLADAMEASRTGIVASSTVDSRKPRLVVVTGGIVGGLG